MDAYKVDDLRHLDLGKDTTRLVVAQTSRVANGESVGTLDGDLSWFATIQFSHTDHFGEGDEVAIFETMTSFVETGYEALIVLHSGSARVGTIGHWIITFSTETIIPVRGVSPVGSIQVNRGPKSVNTELNSINQIFRVL